MELFGGVYHEKIGIGSYIDFYKKVLTKRNILTTKDILSQHIFRDEKYIVKEETLNNSTHIRCWGGVKTYFIKNKFFHINGT